MSPKLTSILLWPLSKIKTYFKRRWGYLDQPVIVPYRTYATSEGFTLSGHVLEERGLKKPHADTSLWGNILNVLRRYWGGVIPDARVEISFDAQKKVVPTDRNGQFFAAFSFSPKSQPAPGWHRISLRLVGEIGKEFPDFVATSEVLISDPRADFGVISDLDDTVLISHATRFLRKMHLMLFKNALTRNPFPGASDFYTVLEQKGKNPFFYVSSSEWNVYDLLVDFLKFQQFPKGILLLRDFRKHIHTFFTMRRRHHHKEEKLQRILRDFPDLSFVLVGDSGQKDVFFYTQLATQFPHRIRAIYIRDVRQRAQHTRMRRLVQQMAERGVTLLFFEDTAEAMQHAQKHGLVPDQS